MKNFTFLFLILGGFILLFSSPIDAQEIGYGFHGGYLKSDSMDSGFYVGGQMRYKLSPAFGFEVAIDYRDEQSDEDIELRENDSYKQTPATTIARSYPLTGTLIFTLFAERVVPINIYGGIGFYFYSLTFRPEGHSELPENDVRFGYHLGVGTEYPISLGVKLDGGFRYLFLDLQNEYGDVLLSEAQANAFMINLGLTFYF